MVLEQKHTYKPMGQKREPRSEPALLRAVNLQQKRQEYTTEEKTTSSTNSIRINNNVLLYSTGNYIQYPVVNHNGKEYKKECQHLFWGLQVYFPSGPVVKTLPFQSRGMCSIPGWGTKIPCAMQCSQ